MELKDGEILFNLKYKKNELPNKIFKAISIDKIWGTVEYQYKTIRDSIEISDVRKATFKERILYKLYYQFI